MTNVAEKMWNAAQQFGDCQAIVDSDGRYSYRELAASVRGIQNRLAEHGPILGRVGILTDDSMYSYAAIVAVLASGAAYVPINSKNPPLRNIDVIERAEVEIVITHDDQINMSLVVDGVDPPEFINARKCEPDDRPWTLAPVTDDTLAYILFTSGSTGRPKGVPITHGNLLAFVDATFGSGPYTAEPSDKFLQMSELTFDLSVVSFVIPLSYGASICIVPTEGIGFMNAVTTLEDEAITVAVMVPSVLSYLKRYMPELEFPNVRLSLFCGEALPHDLLKLWSACVPNAVIENTYGPTEATVFCTRYPYSEQCESEDVYQGVISIGRALNGVELLVLDDNNELQPAGTRGELCIAGPQLFSGYWKDPEKSDAAISTLAIGSRELSIYHSGDIVYENVHGNLIFCGRKDSQVKIDGHRVELGEIEHQAREFLGHSMVAVLLVERGNNQKSLELFAEIGAESDAEKLADYLADRLPMYMRPSHIEALASMPLNLNGKIDRPAIRKLLQTGATDSGNSVS